MKSLKRSEQSQARRCQTFVRKLNKQVDLIAEEARIFNQREQERGGQSLKINLKSLSQPKHQKIILEKDLNPQYKKVENNIKISKLFKNCSTFTQSNFSFVNPSILFGEVQSMPTNRQVTKEGQLKRKIQRKQKLVETCWSKIDFFRMNNQMQGKTRQLQSDKITNRILAKIENRRPSTTGTARTKQLQFSILEG